jgi:hypothetical protein
MTNNIPVPHHLPSQASSGHSQRADADGPLPPRGGDHADPEALCAITQRSRQLTRAGQSSAARRLLTGVLADLDPVTAPTHPALIDLVYGYLLEEIYADDAPRSAHDEAFTLSWSLYASRAAESTFDTSSPRWDTIACAHAAVLTAQGLTGDAVTVARHQLTVAARSGRPGELVQAYRSLATALHNDGQCADAHHEIDATLLTWLFTGAQPHERGTHILRSYLLMLAGCGQRDRAHTVLNENQHLAGTPGSDKRTALIWPTFMKLNDEQRRHAPDCQLNPAAVCPASTEQIRAEFQSWFEVLFGAPAAGSALYDLYAARLGMTAAARTGRQDNR